MRRVWTVWGIIGLCAVLAWLLSAPERSTQFAGRHADIEETGAENPVGAATAGPREPTTLSRTDIGAAAPPRPATIHGRCVDRDGEPLAGVHFSLQGWAASEARQEQWGREHGPIEWQAPEPRSTGADGRFTVSFVPPPPFDFSLDLEHRTGASLSARWSQVESGADIDVGDVVVPDGVEVRGRVNDPKGSPRSGVTVYLESPRADEPGPLQLTRFMYVDSAPDGTFRFPDRLLPGRWAVSVRDAELVSPANVELDAPQTTLDIVVAGDDGLSLRGVVVDELGKPVWGADIRIGSYHQRSTFSRRDGTFVAHKPPMDEPDARFPIWVDADGYESLSTEARYHWGDENVRLVLPRGLELRVAVRRAANGLPVESFGVRLFEDPRNQGSSASRVRGGWFHEHGVLVIEGVRRGTHLLSVEPSRSTRLAAVYFLQVSVQDGPAQTVEVHLPEETTRGIRVHGADGSPIEGMLVELLQSRADAMVASVDKQLTGADGIAAMRGAPNVDYSVRVSGQRYMTSLAEAIRLEDPATLSIEVNRGATLIGRLEPLDVLGDLREEAGLPRNAPAAGRRGRIVPAVRLQLGEPAETRPPYDQSVPVDESGGFTATGVPPGSWDVVVLGRRKQGVGVTQTRRLVQRGVVLTAGKTSEIRIDIGSLRRTRLRGAVVLDDQPYTGELYLRGWLAGEQSDPHLGRQDVLSLQPDSQGCFATLLSAGSWQATVRREFPRGPSIDLVAEPVLTVNPGEKLEFTFVATSVTQRFRVVRPDGGPAANVVLRFRRGNEGPNCNCQATDSHGRTEVFTSPGNLEVATRMRSLRDERAFYDHCVNNKLDFAAVQRLYVALGTVVLPGSGDPIELRLPPEWDR